MDLVRNRLGTGATVDDLVEALGPRGFGALISLLALPAALPFPAAGYAIPFGMGIVILGLGLATGKGRPWLPARILKHRLPLPRPDSRIWRVLAYLESLFRERPPKLQGPLRVIAGAVTCCMGVLMMIPIPGTNTLPGASTFLMGLGLLYGDGLWTSAAVALGAGLLGLYAAAAVRIFRLVHLFQ